MRSFAGNLSLYVCVCVCVCKKHSASVTIECRGIEYPLRVHTCSSSRAYNYLKIVSLINKVPWPEMVSLSKAKFEMGSIIEFVKILILLYQNIQIRPSPRMPTASFQ